MKGRMIAALVAVEIAILSLFTAAGGLSGYLWRASQEKRATERLDAVKTILEEWQDENNQKIERLKKEAAEEDDRHH